MILEQLLQYNILHKKLSQRRVFCATVNIPRIVSYLYNKIAKMSTRPSWISLQNEIAVRKTLTDVGKLQAVKDVMELTKTAGFWGNTTDGNGVLLPHARNYNGTPFGLKEAKDYVDQLETWKDPVEELKSTVEEIWRLQSTLEEMVKMAFPGLKQETVDRALKDPEFMNQLVNTGSAANRFGV